LPPTSFAVGPSTATFWKTLRNLRALPEIASSCAPTLEVELCILITVPTPVGYGGSFSQTQHAIVNDPWFAVVHEPMFVLAYELANTAQRIAAEPPSIVCFPARIMPPPPA